MTTLYIDMAEDDAPAISEFTDAAIFELAERAGIRSAVTYRHYGSIDALTNHEIAELQQLKTFAKLVYDLAINSSTQCLVQHDHSIQALEQ